MTDVHELLIIGGGPAAYTAALYAARGDLEPFVIEGYAARRPAHDHLRRRQLPRLPRRHPGPGADGGDARAGRALRHGLRDGRRHARRVLQGPAGRAARRRGRRRAPSRPRRHRRHRRDRAPAPRAGRAAAAGPRRVLLRGLRRGLLPRPARGRRGRRRLRDGGGDVPGEVRHRGHGRAPPRRAARVEDHAGPRPRQPQDPLGAQRRRRGGPRRGRTARSRPSASATSTPARRRTCPRTACSSPSATIRRRASSRASSTWTTPATCSRRAAPRPTSPACSRPATSSTTSTARRSPPPGMGCMAALDAERWLTAAREAARATAT